jgi:hypothetical protein
MSVRRIFEPKNLPYAGAIVQAVLFAIAGQLFFPFAGWLVGLGVGAVVNYSLALASSRFSDIAEKRKPLARLALVAMFLLSPTTITLSMFYADKIYAAIAWAMCVDLSIILAGAIAGKTLMPESKLPKAKSKKPKVAETLPQVAPVLSQEPAPLPKAERKLLTNEILLAYLAENKEQTQEQVAEFFGVKRQAIGARMKKIYAPKVEK